MARDRKRFAVRFTAARGADDDDAAVALQRDAVGLVAAGAVVEINRDEPIRAERRVQRAVGVEARNEEV